MLLPLQAEEGETRVAQLTSEKVALQKELMQVKLVAEEAEATGERLTQELAEAKKKLAQEQAEAERLKASLREAEAMLGTQSGQLVQGRRLLDSVSAELGILSSRLHRVQQENQALRAARRQQQQQEEEGLLQQQRGVGYGGSAMSPGSSRSAGGDGEQQQEQEMLSCSSGSSSDAEDLSPATSRDPSPTQQERQQRQQEQDFEGVARSESSSDQIVPLCRHGQLNSSCLVCICQRYLESTQGVSSGSSASASRAPGAAAAGLSRASVSSLAQLESSSSGSGPGIADAAQQYREFLGMSELARNRLEAENSQLHGQLEAANNELSLCKVHAAKLQGQAAALASCQLEELRQLEGKLEASVKTVRQLVLERVVAESQQRASAESRACMVCMEAPRSLVFNCGHQSCEKCGERMEACPFCRQAITAKIKLFGV